MYFGSPFYIGSLVFLVAVAGLLWRFLRCRSEKTQRLAVLLLMLVNTLQHLLKPWIYPQYFGMGFSSLSSAYNMCACLILMAPAVHLWGGRFAKNFLYFAGSFAGLAAVAVPYWYIGMEVGELGWDYARFYICHGILFVASVLPLLLGLHKLSYREFWQVGLGTLLTLCVILLNDILFITMGLYEGTDVNDLYGSLVQLNPFSIMGPPEGFPWLADLVGFFTPKFFLGANPTGRFVPILWYALPLYLLISLVSFAAFAMADRKRLIADLRGRKEKLHR